MRKEMSILRKIEMAFRFQDREIDNLLANRHTNASTAIARFEHAKRQVLERKMRVGWDVDE